MLKNQWEIIKKSKIQLFLFVCLLGMHSGAFSKQKVDYPCLVSSDCNRGLRCVAFKCEPGCNVSANCELGNICKANNCEAGCIVAANCPHGNICKAGKCKAGCNLDSNCSLGQICTAGQCVAGCKNVINCPDDKLCIDGQCKVVSNVARGGRCRDDANCQSGLKCKGIVKKCKQKITLLQFDDIAKVCIKGKIVPILAEAGIGGLVGAAIGATAACFVLGIGTTLTSSVLSLLTAGQYQMFFTILATGVPLTLSVCLGQIGIVTSAAVLGGVAGTIIPPIMGCFVNLLEEYYFVGK